MLAYLTNKTFVTALLTVLAIVLLQTGLAPTVLYLDKIVPLVLALLTGVFGVNAENAAYIQGVWDQLEDALDGDDA